MESTLDVRSITKSFGGALVVDEVSITVAPGQIAVIVGPSGSGKTTVLRCIAGFERPDSGEIRIDGAPVTESGLFVAPENRHVGYVPQEGALFPHLSVAGNIGFGLPRGGMRSERVAECLELVGLAGLGDRRVDELSGGQQQRVALARALAPRPRLVVMDEPFSALDAALRPAICADVVSALRGDAATAVIVTHDRDEALAVADLIAVMMDGKIVQCADPVTLHRHPVSERVRSFLGDVDVTTGRLVGHEVITPLGTFRAESHGPISGEVDVILRRGQVRVYPEPVTGA